MAMRFWATVERLAQRRYRVNQATALHFKRRLDVRTALQTYYSR